MKKRSYDHTTGEGQKRLFYEVQLGFDPGPPKVINVTAPGDYGADPLEGGLFRMVPSGDVVDGEEKEKRLRRG